MSFISLVGSPPDSESSPLLSSTQADDEKTPTLPHEPGLTTDISAQYAKEKASVAKNTEHIVVLYNRILELSEFFATEKDTQKMRALISKNIEAANEVANNIRTSIAKLGRLNVGTEQEKREKKQYIGKLEQTFSRFFVEFRQRTAWIEEQMKSPLPGAIRVGDGDGSLSTRETGSEEDTMALLRKPNASDLQLIEEVDYQSIQINERDEAIRKLRREMTEVHNVFHDLANLVSEQGELIFDIESHIENSELNSSKATAEIRAAQRYQKKESSNLCVFTVIILVIIIILVLILVLVFKVK
ncbi:uncharacterized protein LOC126325506 [Schistocerca gregaria]|uniref:uncharacterized protein LOC126325506 n=1 Tax=Schistocerca gregaria TaxID=7010 RepID=UPI00211EBD64|nr:uncharacterized protein LOC126325506 [Schistocerca gregaria]